MADRTPPDDTTEHNTGVLTEETVKLEKPPKFKVVLHNDDYTTMEFVVYVLMTIFHKELEAATAIMLAVHQQGVGIAGVYTYEVAEAKCEKVVELARANEYPLLCTVEAE